MTKHDTVLRTGNTGNNTQPEKRHSYDGRRLPMSTYKEIILNETRGMDFYFL